MSSDNRDRLAHVRWLGGGTGAGKSSVARALGAAGRAHVYTCDLVEREHAPELMTDAARWIEPAPADVEARWVRGSPEALAGEAMDFHRRRFPLIVRDLLALPAPRPRLVEGFGVLPGLVAPLLGQPEHALFLVPSAEFRRRAIEDRGWPDPDLVRDRARALDTRLRRDALLADAVAREARELGLRVIEVDGGTGAAEAAEAAARWLGIPPADGPEWVALGRALGAFVLRSV